MWNNYSFRLIKDRKLILLFNWGLSLWSFSLSSGSRTRRWRGSTLGTKKFDIFDILTWINLNGSQFHYLIVVGGYRGSKFESIHQNGIEFVFTFRPVFFSSRTSNLEVPANKTSNTYIVEFILTVSTLCRSSLHGNQLVTDRTNWNVIFSKLFIKFNDCTRMKGISTFIRILKVTELAL